MVPDIVAQLIIQAVPDGMSRIRNLYCYGSLVYGTDNPDSDTDYIAVMDGDVGEEYTLSNGEAGVHRVDVTLYDVKRFRQQLDNHEISVIECLYASDILQQQLTFAWTLDRGKLRESLSAKSSNSFVKAKKKFEVEREPYIAKKSLWHSLRILNFGIQLATTGTIQDYTAANHWWKDILANSSVIWDDYKMIYQPIYNALKTEFRKVAPLAENK